MFNKDYRIKTKKKFGFPLNLRQKVTGFKSLKKEIKQIYI